MQYLRRRYILFAALLTVGLSTIGLMNLFAPAPTTAAVAAAPRYQGGTATPIPFPRLRSFLQDVPFPRTYMFYHVEPAATPTPKCVSSSHKATLLEPMAIYANVIETHMQFGANDPGVGWSDYAPWRIPASGGACTTSDPKLAQWLEDQSNALANGTARNRWNLPVPHFQIAFMSTWNYNLSVSSFRGRHREAIAACDLAYATPPLTPTANYKNVQTWALHTTTGQIPTWAGGYGGVNVLATTPTPFRDVQCITSTSPNGSTADWRYVDWLPMWLHERIGSVGAWDGVRMDLPGNIHSYWTPPDVDQDLDGCKDYAQNGAPVTSGPCPTEASAIGRKYLDTIYRNGNQVMFSGIHTEHSNWLIGGDDAWMPAEDPAVAPTPYMPGFAQKPDIDFTIAENWTDKWGDAGLYQFTGWANPDTGGFTNVDFAQAIKIWDQWSHHGYDDKAYVIMSKCAYNNKPGDWSCPETRWPQMRKEFRFSLAAATQMDAYHSFIGDTNGLIPYWFDEYAVYPNNVAADTAANKAAGIGWLGFPTTAMTRVNANGDMDPNMTVFDALAMSGDTWQPAINDFAWVRYFDHGVVLLNPTATDKPVKLQGSFQRIHCDPTTPDPRVSDCIVNDGTDAPQSPYAISMPAHDGLFLVKKQPLQSLTIANPVDDVAHLEAEAWLPDERGVWSYQRVHQDDATSPIIHPFSTLNVRTSATLNFTSIPINQGTDIEDAFLDLYVDGFDSPDLFLTAADVADAHARWQSDHVGQGRVLSANVKNILQARVDASNWNQKVAFDLEPALLGGEMAFRARDYSAGDAPQLRYRLAAGPNPSAMSVATYQHGVNGYGGGEDTHMVTTTWEPPTPHDTFPVLYVRVNSTDVEVKSALLRFNGVALPPGADVQRAELALNFSGQSVNGGDVYVYLAGPLRSWLAPQTTWVNYRTAQYWQATGAKGVDDRRLHSNVRTVNYTEVGSWIYLDVTDLVRAGVYEYVLYGSYAGVNKDIQFRSNEHWETGKRPKLTIWYQ